MCGLGVKSQNLGMKSQNLARDDNAKPLYGRLATEAEACVTQEL
jgi:hypothetical protein